MTGILVLLLFAAIGGIIKPYINGLRRKHFAIIAVLLFIGIGVAAPKTEEDKKTAASSPAKPEAAAGVAPGNSAEPAVEEPSSKWEYSDSKDEMRGTTAHHASLSSENEVTLDFPYGDISGEIIIRKRPEDGLNAIFRVNKGQILCRNYGETTLSAKFDDGPVKSYRCTGASDGSSETAFISNASGFLQGLKKAKRTVIEAEFYNAGRQQFIFETAQLVWK